MFRTLLTTTAIVAVLQTGAFAADTMTGDPAKPAPVFQENGKYERHATGEGYFEAGPGQILANTLIGMSVYNNASDEADSIGDINDLVISQNGKAEAVIIGVGGFLGIGEKDVAVDFSRIGWVNHNGERWIVIDATKEQLEAAPAYDRTAMRVEAGKDGMMTTGTTEKPVEMQAKDPAAVAGKPARDAMQTVDLASISAQELIGSRVYGENDEDVGEVSDVILSDSGEVSVFVVDVGGFLGIGEKPVAMDPENIDFRKTEDGDLVVFTPFTKDQLEQQASYAEKDYEHSKQDALKAPRS